MNKRGQITLFVIIGVVLVSAIILLYAFRAQILGVALTPEEAQKLVTAQVQPVRDFTDGCMLFAARKTLNTMGRQGGHVLPTANHFNIPSVLPDAPIMSYALFYDSQRGYIKELPSTSEMKDELVTYLESSLDFVNCINNYQSFNRLLNVKAVNAMPKIDRSKVEVGENSGQIVIPYSYPVELSKGNVSTLVEDYQLVIPVNLARIREVSSRITNDIALGKNYLDVIGEEGSKEFVEARDNPNSEKLFTSAEAYTEIPSSQSGVVYNEKNLLFKIRYENPALAVPYEFYFLVGNP
jgi:hypothetical protein